MSTATILRDPPYPSMLCVLLQSTWDAMGSQRQWQHLLAKTQRVNLSFYRWVLTDLNIQRHRYMANQWLALSVPCGHQGGGIGFDPVDKGCRPSIKTQLLHFVQSVLTGFPHLLVSLKAVGIDKLAFCFFEMKTLQQHRATSSQGFGSLFSCLFSAINGAIGAEGLKTHLLSW